MICRWKILYTGSDLKDNATTQKVNRTYQQVVTLNYARSTRQWSGNLTIPTNGRLLNASVDGEPLVILD
uniref:Uncharacterized protein n=1 Tax=Klebsiella pneumoniae TaxID=573 RepID=A0A2P1BNQ3_KLEPN|nr:hypothetical protein [Klebsiella pneumoniae]